MHLDKYPYLPNFAFATVGTWESTAMGRKGRVETPHAPIRVSVRQYQDDVYHLRVRSRMWSQNHSQAELQFPAPATGGGQTELHNSDGLDLALRDTKGRMLLRSVRGKGFGVCGEHAVFVFEHQPAYQYYGMGEKLLGLELTGKSTKFWNLDVLGDFPWSVVQKAKVDPLYVSIPYLVIKQGNTYIGLLLDNPGAAFMQTAAKLSVEGMLDVESGVESVVTLGTESGCPDLVIIYGPTLHELTRKLQRIVGVTPRPPAWALGYHQSRWGYGSEKDMVWLDQNMRKHGLPCDGLWLDIDYMQGYRVFTWDKRHFPDPATAMAKLTARGRKLVPIIDPGVKHECRYPVYAAGHAVDAFCHNPQGREYIGLVWPGNTAFPDFSRPETRAWWAAWCRQFAELGIVGAWLDMNDPSTGSVDSSGMLFNQGKFPHHTYHNQYATGMARATQQGFLAAHPDLRPFLLSRSGSTGCQKYTAIWTGDNVSNYAYMRASIACSLNLALSGVPFNGADVGGFGGSAWGQLMQDWTRVAFLFPFFRIHCAKGAARQEPWAFDQRTLDVLRHYIQLRYRLRPYLYNLFVEQERSGDAILRPLFYDFADTKALPLGYVDDQFLVGPSILQAPLLEEGKRAREVVLPGKQDWWSAPDGDWQKGNQRLPVKMRGMQTPLYIREGAVIPVSTLPDADNRFDGFAVDFHIFLRPGGLKSTRYTYTVDDGSTFAYRAGNASELEITVRQLAHEGLRIRVNHHADACGRCTAPAFVLYGDFKHVELVSDGVASALSRKRYTWPLAGHLQRVWRWC